MIRSIPGRSVQNTIHDRGKGAFCSSNQVILPIAEVAPTLTTCFWALVSKNLVSWNLLIAHFHIHSHACIIASFSSITPFPPTKSAASTLFKILEISSSITLKGTYGRKWIEQIGTRVSGILYLFYSIRCFWWESNRNESSQQSHNSPKGWIFAALDNIREGFCSF